MAAELHALLIGTTDCAEFRAAAATVSQAVRLHTVRDFKAAAETIVAGLRPDVMVIVQRRPGEIAPEAVEALRRLAPLAVVVALQSSWCEGEGRSGRPLPGVVRVSWRRFESEILPGLIRLREGRLPDWAGPATTTPEERLLRQSADPLPQGRGAVGILAHSHEARRLLADICRAGGWSVAQLRGLQADGGGTATSIVSGPHGQDGHATAGACDVVLWDAGQVPGEMAPVICLLRERVGNAPVIILVDFPRPTDIEQALAIGAAGVIAKPFAAVELLDEIARVASHAGQPDPDP